MHVVLWRMCVVVSMPFTFIHPSIFVSSMTRFHGRRWLGQISYRTGSLTTAATHTTQPLSALSGYLQQTETIRKQLISSSPPTSLTADELPGDARHMRWFLMPNEAAQLMKAPQGKQLEWRNGHCVISVCVIDDCRLYACHCFV